IVTLEAQALALVVARLLNQGRRVLLIVGHALKERFGVGVLATTEILARTGHPRLGTVLRGCFFLDDAVGTDRQAVGRRRRCFRRKPLERIQARHPEQRFLLLRLLCFVSLTWSGTACALRRQVGGQALTLAGAATPRADEQGLHA